MILATLLACLLSGLLSSGTAPSESRLLGHWGYAGNTLVFMEKSGDVPDQAEVDSHLNAMGASRSNLTLTFTEGRKGRLKLGDNAIDFDWELNASTKEFKAGVGLFSIKGYLVMKEDRIILTYTRANLFLLMRYLCTPAGRKHINPLGELLDCCKGLTVAMEFSKGE